MAKCSISLTGSNMMHFGELLLSCSCELITVFQCFSQPSESRCGFIWPFVYLTFNGGLFPYLNPVHHQTYILYIGLFLKDIPKTADQSHRVFYVKSIGD